MVVISAQVRQHDRAGTTVPVIRQELRYGSVRKVAGAAHDALLEIPRVRTGLEHVQVVVRFDHERVRTQQVVSHRIRHVPQIRCDRELATAIADAEPDWVDRVVRDRERLDIEVADRELAAGLERDQRRGSLLPRQVVGCQPRHVDRYARLAGKDFQPLDMIRVLVRDHDGVERTVILANGLEPQLDLSTAKAGVEQDANGIGGNEGRVAARAAS